MHPDKFNELLMHLMINTQAEILALKDIVLSDIMLRHDHKTIEEIESFKKKYEALRVEFQNNIIAKIRARYDDSLGSVDDLLSGVF